MSSRRAALVAGAATLGLVAAASALAWRDGSPLVPRDGGLARQGTAWLFFALLVAAFSTYVLGIAAMRRTSVPVRLALGFAVAVQVVPLTEG